MSSRQAKSVEFCVQVFAGWLCRGRGSSLCNEDFCGWPRRLELESCGIDQSMQGVEMGCKHTKLGGAYPSNSDGQKRIRVSAGDLGAELPGLCAFEDAEDEALTTARHLFTLAFRHSSSMTLRAPMTRPSLALRNMGRKVCTSFKRLLCALISH